MDRTTAVGIVLATGGGTRFGMPRALDRSDGGTPWLELACETLVEGGCAEVVVVLGAREDETGGLAQAPAPAFADAWESGLAAALRTGLTSAQETGADVAVVSLVDLPALRADAVRRLLEPFAGPDTAQRALARATYGGRPGHPVVVGRAHWPALREAVCGGVGAGPYLLEHGAADVDCSDLGGGDDVDRW